MTQVHAVNPQTGVKYTILGEERDVERDITFVVVQPLVDGKPHGSATRWQKGMFWRVHEEVEHEPS